MTALATNGFSATLAAGMVEYGPTAELETATVDFAEVRRALALLLDPARPHEIRQFPALRGSGNATSLGVSLADINDAVSRVGKLADRERGGGIYFTLNPVRPGLCNASARDADIVRRRWLLIDVDPDKAPGQRDHSATDAEHSQALGWGRDVAEFLTGIGWPGPVVVDSGNGCHLLYRIDLPNDVASTALVRGALAALNFRFPAVDAKVSNASRISKLPGTWARKGVDTVERPHRICRLLSVPDAVEVVPVDRLEALPGAVKAAGAPSYADLMADAEARLSPYLLRALKDEIARVAKAPDGERNNTLNAAAFSLGQLVPHGLDLERTRTLLILAATRAGLSEAEATDVIDRALTKGQENPRDNPPTMKDRADKPTLSPQSWAALSDAELGILSADSIEPENVQPLWADRVYVGKLNLFVGESGEGKSQTAYRVAAAVTDPAVMMPDGSPALDHGTVVIIAPEDGASDTLVPRLKAAGADLSRIKILTAKVSTKAKDGTPLVSLQSFQDLAWWRYILSRIGNVRLLIADPIPSCLGKGVNDYRNQEVRLVLEPFADLMNEMGVALLGVTHLGKSPDLKNPSHKILGSVAYAAISRSIHFTVRDPETPGRRYLCHEKNTYGPGAPSLAFTIEPFEVVRADGEIVRASRVAYEAGTVDANASDLMNADRGPGKKRGPAPEKSSRLAEWLFDYLTANGGKRVLAAIFNDAGEAGLIGHQKPDGKWSGHSSLYNARDRVGSLEGSRAGWEIVDFKAPCVPGGRSVVFWGLNPSKAATDPGKPLTWLGQSGDYLD